MLHGNDNYGEPSYDKTVYVYDHFHSSHSKIHLVRRTHLKLAKHEVIQAIFDIETYPE